LKNQNETGIRNAGFFYPFICDQRFRYRNIRFGKIHEKQGFLNENYFFV